MSKKKKKFKLNPEITKAFEKQIMEEERLANLDNEINHEEIRKSMKKKKVSSEIFYQFQNPNDCDHCMHYNDETDSCELNMPNIDPWYTKDNDLLDECEKWDYIYETDDDE